MFLLIPIQIVNGLSLIQLDLTLDSCVDNKQAYQSIKFPSSVKYFCIDLVCVYEHSVVLLEIVIRDPWC